MMLRRKGERKEGGRETVQTDGQRRRECGVVRRAMETRSDFLSKDCMTHSLSLLDRTARARRRRDRQR